MSLAALIRGTRSEGRSPDKSATATPATPATLDRGKGRTVATVATVAVANPQKLTVQAERDRAETVGAAALDSKAEALTASDVEQTEFFEFAPPNDPANDDEALQERIALMVECGMDEARARQEAVWHADRERCWRAFLRNAQRVLAVPEAHREALLARYLQEATRRYGEATGRDMAGSLRSWVVARGVH